MKDINEVGVIVDKFGSNMTTNSGKRVSIMAPSPEQICLEDIAHALAMQCRYSGQCDKFYSVAEHVVKGAILIVDSGGTEGEIKAWLLHDASEAYVGDIIRPVKVYLPAFKEIEEGFHKVIYDKYKAPRASTEKLVYHYDNVMCALEKHYLFANNKDVWQGLPPVEHLYGKFNDWGWDPSKAKDNLLRWFDYYFKGDYDARS